MVWDPQTRSTLDSVLQHPWVGLENGLLPCSEPSPAATTRPRRKPCGPGIPERGHLQGGFGGKIRRGYGDLLDTALQAAGGGGGGPGPPLLPQALGPVGAHGGLASEHPRSPASPRVRPPDGGCLDAQHPLRVRHPVGGRLGAQHHLLARPPPGAHQRAQHHLGDNPAAGGPQETHHHRLGRPPAGGGQEYRRKPAQPASPPSTDLRPAGPSGWRLRFSNAVAPAERRGHEHNADDAESTQISG
ncbi:proline-rich proteoglycan 2-like [Talpa occidentalis]|uniref:proline-rich proteoglycan 2-like n=1 Tax=Talpa occidentalis TaxID=50954 RepID=UPI001890AAD0|nr:proline-rich proteoglycan 2-like [Talpa occidentalis]